LHYDPHSKGWLIVKKLLSLLIALSILAGSAAMVGCSDTSGKDKDKKKDKDTPAATDKAKTDK
jgi:hypothetical protein